MSGPSYHPPMNTAEELNVWWTYEARSRKAVFIALVVAWLSAGLFLHSDVVKILATDPIHAPYQLPILEGRCHLGIHQHIIVCVRIFREDGPMTLDEFRESLTATEPPARLTHALAGLWWDGKGDWKRAHESAQQDEGARVRGCMPTCTARRATRATPPTGIAEQASPCARSRSMRNGSAS